MLTGRRGLVRMYLCFFCLLALTHQADEQNCFQGILRLVETSITSVTLKPLNCSLYTPTIDDYEKCPNTTMKCFADEVKVLFEEWNTVKENTRRGSRLIDALEDLALERNQTNSECLQCELLNVTNAKEFLESLQLTLQMMNNEPGTC